MNYLLIDDLASKGWSSVLESTITKQEKSIENAETFDEAIDKLTTTKYKIIFLDVRMVQDDNNSNKNIEDFTGFKILKKIKSNFSNTNFSTPIILLTATNKIWNIDKFKENGIDSFYIKEHPSYVSKVFSSENLQRLQKDFIYLSEEAGKRNEIWSLINVIINNCGSTIINKNIKKRFIDKLKMGYNILFQKQPEYSKKMFVSQNEILAFIVFWSTLEEVSKAIYDNNWIEDGTMLNNNWKLPNNEYFIKKITDHTLEVGITNHLTKGKQTLQKGDEKYNLYKDLLNLSTQIYGICLLNDYKNSAKLVSEFKKLNKYRNKIDFIHSKVDTIFEQSLSKNYHPKDVYDKCSEMLKFLKKITVKQSL